MSNVVDSGRRTDSGQVIWVPKSQAEPTRQAPTTTRPQTSGSVYISPALSSEAQERYRQMQQTQVISREEAERRQREAPPVTITQSPAMQRDLFGDTALGQSIAPEKQTFMQEVERREAEQRSDNRVERFKEQLERSRRLQDGTATQQDIFAAETQQLERMGIRRAAPPTQTERIFDGVFIRGEVGRQVREIERFESERDATVSRLLSSGESPADVANILTGRQKEVTEQQFSQLQPLIAASGSIQRSVNPDFLAAQRAKVGLFEQKVSLLEQKQMRLDELDSSVRTRLSSERRDLSREIERDRREIDYIAARGTPEPSFLSRAIDKSLDVRTSFIESPVGRGWRDATGTILKPLYTSASLPLYVGERFDSPTATTIGSAQISALETVQYDPLPLGLTFGASGVMGRLFAQGTGFLARQAASTTGGRAWAAALGVTAAKTTVYGGGIALAGYEGYQISQIEDAARRGQRLGTTLTYAAAGTGGFVAGASTSPFRATTVRGAVLEEVGRQRAAGARILFTSEGVAPKTTIQRTLTKTAGTAKQQSLLMGETRTTAPTGRRLDLLQEVRMGRNLYFVRETYQPGQAGVLQITRDGRTILQREFTPQQGGTQDSVSTAIQARRVGTSRELVFDREGVNPLQISRQTDMFAGQASGRFGVEGQVIQTRVTTTRQSLTQPAFRGEYGVDYGVSYPLPSRFTTGGATPQTRIDLTSRGYRIESPGRFLQEVTVQERATGFIQLGSTPQTAPVVPSQPTPSILTRMFASKRAQSTLLFDIKSLSLPSSTSQTAPRTSVRSRLPTQRPGQRYGFMLDLIAETRFQTAEGLNVLNIPSTDVKETEVFEVNVLRDLSAREYESRRGFITVPAFDISMLSSTAQSQTSAQTQQMQQISQVVSEPVQPTPGTPPPPAPAPRIDDLPGRTPFIGITGMLPIDAPVKAKEKKRVKQQGTFGYVPSFEAIALGITGEKQEKSLYTGLEIRPVIGKKSPGVFFGIQRGMKW